MPFRNIAKIFVEFHETYLSRANWKSKACSQRRTPYFAERTKRDHHRQVHLSEQSDDEDVLQSAPWAPDQG